jgi:hypothetical protein
VIQGEFFVGCQNSKFLCISGRESLSSIILKNDIEIKSLPYYWNIPSIAFFKIFQYLYIIQSVPELPPHRKQACPDSKRDFKINVSVAHITEFSILPIQKLVLKY